MLKKQLVAILLLLNVSGYALNVEVRQPGRAFILKIYNTHNNERLNKILDEEDIDRQLDENVYQRIFNLRDINIRNLNFTLKYGEEDQDEIICEQENVNPTARSILINIDDEQGTCRISEN